MSWNAALPKNARFPYCAAPPGWGCWPPSTRPCIPPPPGWNGWPPPYPPPGRTPAGPDSAGPPQADAGDCLAALVCEMTPGEGEAVIRRLRLTRRQAGLVRDTIELRRLASELAAAARCPSRLVRLLEPLGETALAAGAKIGNDPIAVDAVRRYLGELRYVRPALRAGDLLAMGAVPGPELGALLAHLRAARLDGRAPSSAAERRLAAEWLHGTAAD